MAQKRPNADPVRQDDAPKLKSFDGSNPNHYDVVLIVDGEKFHVLKGYLAQQSDYFDRLFFSNYRERNKKEVQLEDVDSRGFQLFLELLHGLPCLNDNNVEMVLKVADYCDAPIAIQKCHEFLMEKSGMPIKKQFDVAVQHDIESLKTKALSRVANSTEFLSILPEDVTALDESTKDMLLVKSISLHNPPAARYCSAIRTSTESPAPALVRLPPRPQLISREQASRFREVAQIFQQAGVVNTIPVRDFPENPNRARQPRGSVNGDAAEINVRRESTRRRVPN